jgi:hypothetical protein
VAFFNNPSTATMANPFPTPLNYKQVIRTYTSIKDIMDGSNKDFLNEAELMPDHPLSQAFSKLEQKTINFVAGSCYVDMFAEVLVDGITIVGVKEVPNMYRPNSPDRVPFFDL